MLCEEQARSDELCNCNLIDSNCNPINATQIAIDAGAAVAGYAGVCGPLANPADPQYADESTSGGNATWPLRGEATAQGWQLPRPRGALKVWICRGVGAVAVSSPFQRLGTTFQACQMFVRISHMARLNVIVDGEAVDVMPSTPVSDFAKVPRILAVPLQIQADLAL